MPARSKKPVELDLVVPAEEMMAQAFRLHCQKRHPNMGFWNRGEHTADHRLHPDQLDHIHEEVGKTGTDPPIADDEED